MRRRSLTGVLGAAVVALFMFTGFGYALAGAQQSETFTVPNGGIGTRQTTEALIGGCGATFQFNPNPNLYGTVPTTRPDGTPYRQVYSTIVPMFGRFWDAPIDTTVRKFWAAGDTPPVAENLLYNQWNGELVAWYTPKAAGEDVQRLKDLATSRPDLNMVVVPWEQRRGPLPDNRNIAFATWAASQTCARFNENVLLQYREKFPASSAPGYDGTKPPRIRAKFEVQPAPSEQPPTGVATTAPATPK